MAALPLRPTIPPLPSSSISPKPTSPTATTLFLPKSTTATNNLSLQFKEKILCLEIMGVDAGRALSRNPALRSATIHSLNDVISFLQSKGIHQKDLARIFGMCPTVLTASIAAQIRPVFTFLTADLLVPEKDLRRVINKCPRLLVSSVDDQLRPALAYLRRIGLTDLRSLAYRDPILLVSSVEGTLIPKIRYLESVGFAGKEAVGMVVRCPALFTFSVENNFKPKFEYFTAEMEGRLEDLREFPQYFAFSLEKRIKPRYEEVVRSGVDVALPVMLKSTDEEFKELISHRSGSRGRR